MKIFEKEIKRNNLLLNALEVELPNTTLLILEGYGGFVMCGALDVGIYNTQRMIERKVICAKAIGVKSIDELYNAHIYESSIYAQSLGLVPSMLVYDFFKKLSKEE